MFKKLFRGAVWLGGVLFWIVLIAGIIGTGAGIYYLYREGFFETPDISKLNDRRSMSVFIDERGERIRETCEYCRELSTLEEMGHFPEFAVAVEDKNFKNRWMPYDWKGFIRAALANLKAGEAREGSSTITMQVARNTFLEKELAWQKTAPTPEGRTKAKWWRKSREAWVSAWLEFKIGKENRWKILEVYLNTFYCGGNTYGVLACSRKTWGKAPKELNEAEVAWILGLVRSPRFWTLAEKDKTEATALRNRVLAQLTEERKINWSQKEEFEKYPLPENPAKHEKDPCKATHAAELARIKVAERTTVADAGLEIHLPLNCEWNRVAAWAMEESMAAMKTRNPEIANDLWGLAMAIDARNGDIKVFTQNPDFSQNQFRADQIKRHAGSAAKPFGTLAALTHGLRLSCDDEGTDRCNLNDSSNLSILIKTGKGYERKYFQNFPYEGLRRYLGTAEPLLCLAESRNACFLSMIKGISGGVGFLHKDDLTETLLRLKIRLPVTKGTDILSEELAARMQIKREFLDPGHSGVIGSFDVSAKEMAEAWAAFYGENMPESRIVDKVVDDTEELIEFPPQFHGNILANIWIETQKEETRRAEVSRLAKISKNKSRRTIYLSVLRQMTFDEADLATRAPREAEKISHALIRGLRATVEFEHGTAKLARLGSEKRGIPKLDFQIACKTGTATNQHGDTTDNWIACRTVSHVMVVWIGRKNNLPMKTIIINPETGAQKEYQETGGGNALPVLIKTFAKIYETYPREKFPDETDPLKPFVHKIDAPKTDSDENKSEDAPEEEIKDTF